ncbi:terpene cyclase/mutase family protein [Halomicrobium sp. IBSBa]|uniref:prenyltransferase/squalene oxidase repeat-containing protein n=1 Tax=Halomicrobium sp. IBSBa TaxID=2778916 RepID=UPI001ABF9D58|nr:prenyltransferase/squalene oxidase repeat-containing protein [Halomicrobium sp. IBSBa]MBO4248901.1 terpene cyclase/mutase family protein [Halomicrobium sp. IBSBa]
MNGWSFSCLLGAVGRDLTKQSTTPHEHDSHLRAAIDWLSQSQDATGTGGAAATYNLLTGWAGPYPETSGYIVPTLYDYAAYTGESEPAERAERMTDWVRSTQLESGAFPGGVDPGPDPDPSVFNTGQILFGLLRTYDETGTEANREAAIEAGDWLCDVQHARGYWDQYDYRDEIHAYCSRVAWGLLELYERTETDRFRTAAAEHLEWVTNQQRENGWFEYAAFSPDEVPPLHTIAYTIRGLLEGGFVLNDDRLVDVARRSASRLADIQRSAGPLAGAYSDEWTPADHYCLTGNAQMALVWLRLADEENDFPECAERAIDFVKSHQQLDAPPQTRGAIAGSSPIWGPYLRLQYPNWAAKFFADALLLSMRHETPPTSER